jgi:hypothetical protein
MISSYLEKENSENMINPLAIIIGIFLFFLIIIIIWIGVRFLYSIATIGQSKHNYYEDTEKQLFEDSNENSEADLAMTTDYEDAWMFPPESDE